MTRDEARRLMSSYATGALNDAERRLLFEAALEDQDLFDELAREDELKQLLEAPGARDRLIAAVSPDVPRGAWQMPLVWGGISIAAAIVAVVSWVAFRPPKPVEVAKVDQVAVTPSPSVAEPAQPAPPVAATAPANPPALKKKAAPAIVEPATEAKDAALPAGSAAAGPPSQQQAPSPQSPSRQAVPMQAQNGFMPSAGAVGGGGGARPAARALAAPARPRRFGFDYTYEPETLILKFAVDGWFSLHFSPGDDTISLAHVTAGQTRREAIPNNATEAAIVFAVEAQTDPTLGVQITRADKSGTVEDPSGSRIEFLLKFY